MIRSLFNQADKDLSAFSMPSFDIEKEILKIGYDYVAGIDEAGRGALAGPLGVGLVIFDPKQFELLHDDLKGIIKDSKQLSEAKRHKALSIILDNCIYADTEMISHHEIDMLNINGATFLAIEKLMNRLLKKGTYSNIAVIIDGNFSFKADYSIYPIKKGDNKSYSIAAASIFAKVHRDTILQSIDKKYPEYGFKNNKGYGTKNHINSIYKLGYCAVHRKTYEPVKGLVETSSQLKL